MTPAPNSPGPLGDGTTVTDTAATLPEKAADTRAENPWPLRLLSAKIVDYVARMSPVWVEGQIIQLTRRPGAWSVFLTLRDTDTDMSLPVTIPARTLDALPHEIAQGARVVVHAKATFWAKRGTLQMEARDIKPVGQGELLARLEQLKKLLAAEGLFSTARKRPLPFLPGRVGLICGRNSAAEKDVVENARRRWPAITFELREVPVQGAEAVPAVCRALAELDDDPDVDVIIITRGGGSFEDLLAFSNETLVRAVSAARTPIVSAIGHEVDTPLIDFVADVRASTPTDAAKRVVPDAREEFDAIANARQRISNALGRKLDGERRALTALTARPVLATPQSMLTPYRQQTSFLMERLQRTTSHRLTRARDDISALRGQLRALSPQATLERGYAVVQLLNGDVVTDERAVTSDGVVRVRVAYGSFEAMRTHPEQARPAAAKPATRAPGKKPATTARTTKPKPKSSATPDEETP